MLLLFRLFNGKMNAVYLKQVEYKYYGTWMKWKRKRITKKNALSWEVAIHFKRVASICLRLSWHRIRYNRIETTSKSFVSSFKLIFSHSHFFLLFYCSFCLRHSLLLLMSSSLSQLLLLSSSLSLLFLLSPSFPLLLLLSLCPLLLFICCLK